MEQILASRAASKTKTPKSPVKNFAPDGSILDGGATTPWWGYNTTPSTNDNAFVKLPSTGDQMFPPTVTGPTAAQLALMNQLRTKKFDPSWAKGYVTDRKGIQYGPNGAPRGSKLS